MVAIGLLKERYSRVARYYEIAYDEHRRPSSPVGRKSSANKEPKLSMAVICSRRLLHPCNIFFKRLADRRDVLQLCSRAEDRGR